MKLGAAASQVESCLCAQVEGSGAASGALVRMGGSDEQDAARR